MEFEGEFVQVMWSNPHPRFTFRVTSDDGTERMIELQAWGSPYTLQRAGVEGEHFRTEEQVTIAVRESTRRANQYVLTHTLPLRQWAGSFSSDPGMRAVWDTVKNDMDPDFVQFVDQRVLPMADAINRE